MADGTSIAATTELKVQFVSEDADYNSALGWYNKRTGEAGFLFASTNDDGKNASVHAGDFATFSALQSDIDAGNIGFFLVPDGAKDVAKLSNTTIRFETDHSGNGEIVYDTKHGEKELLGTQGQILFSDKNLNVGDKDYMSGQVGTKGETTAQKFGEQSDGKDGILGTMAWDDQVIQSGNKGTDRDFNDVVFNVSIVNHPPVANGGTFVIDEETALDGKVSATDQDGNALTYELYGPAPTGTFHLFKDGSFSFVPLENFFGDVSFSFIAKDGTSASAPAEVKIHVNAVQDPATITGDFFGDVTNHVSPTDTGTVFILDNDPGENHAKTATNFNAQYGKYSIDADGNWSYVLNDDNAEILKLKDGETREDVFLITSQDGFAHQSVTITIHGANDAPVVSGDISGTLTEDNIFVGGTVKFDDPDDLESGALSDAGTATYGAWDIFFGGNWTYTLTADLQGLGQGEYREDHFTVHSLDGTPQDIAIKIVGVDDLPTNVLINDVESAVVDEATPGAIVGTLKTVDPDTNDTFSYIIGDDRFEIVSDGGSGQILKLKDGVSLDYETTTQVTLAIQTTDSAGATFFDSIIIDVSYLIETGSPGIAIDGYLAGATVFADKNFNGSLDPDETFTLTDLDGKFTIDAGGAFLVLHGGHDQATEVPFNGIMRARPGASVITPLTTLIAAYPGPTEDVLAALGLPPDLDPNHLDPIAHAAAGGDLDPFAISTQIISTLNLATAVLQGNAPGFPTTTLVDALLQAIVNHIGTGQPLDLLDRNFIADVMVAASSDLTINYPLDQNVAFGAAEVIVDNNAIIGEILENPNLNTQEKLTQISAANQVSQFTGSLVLEDYAANAGTTDLSLFTGENLEGQVNLAAHTIVDPTGNTEFGDESDDTTFLTDGDDSYDGKGGTDFIDGLGGNDTLSGGNDNDTLTGGEGDDRLDGGEGSDAIDGGNGNDTVSYESASLQELFISLASGTGTDYLFSQHDSFTSIENVIGSSFYDIITGNDESNILEGRGSGDILYGLGGDDVLIGGTGIDAIYGGLGADKIVHSGNGIDDDDTLYDADGTDYIYLSTPDLYDIDFFRSEEGNLFISGFTPGATDFGGVTVQGHYTGNPIAYVLIDTEFYNELYSGNPDIAKIYFTPDLLNGLNQFDGAEILLGGSEDDIINTNGGFYDAAYGGGGNDVINGADGNEHFRGQDGDDTLNGGAGDDFLRGDAGDDLLDGGDGEHDLVRYDTALGGVIVNLAIGTADDRDGTGNSGHDTILAVENIRASKFADILLGNELSNSIDARAGNDEINAGGGLDFVFGGAGNDTITSDDNEQDIFDGGDGEDRLVTDGGSDRLTGGDGNDIVELLGPPISPDTVAIFRDFILGSDQIDLSQIIAGFSYETSDPLNYVTVTQVTDDDGTHTILQASLNGTGTDFFDALKLENVVLTIDDLLNNGALLLGPRIGTPGPDTVSLTEFNDIFNGAGGSDTIFALGGDDKIDGGADDDEVDLGDGVDTYYHTGALSDGNDTIHTGEGGLDRVVFTTPDLYDLTWRREGDDLIVAPFDDVTQAELGSVRVADHYAGASAAFVQIDFEFYNLDYGTDPEIATFYFTPDILNGIENANAAEILLGSENNDIINGNGGFYDGIFGYGGDDIIDGGEGDDNIRGGEGNDTAMGSGGDDAIRGEQGDDYLDGGDGTDTIRYDRGLVLSGVYVDLQGGIGKDVDGIDDTVGLDTLVNFENVRGSAFGDLIFADLGDNVVLARGGDDTIFGILGADSLLGEGGNDTIQTNGSFGFLSGGDGDDIIIEGIGANSISGGDGDDFVSIGSSASFVEGGTGRDTFLFTSYGEDTFSFIQDLELGPTGDIIDVSSLGPIDPNAIDQYLAVFDSDPDAFLMFDPTGTGTVFTPVAFLTNMAGLTLQELIDGGNLEFGLPFSDHGSTADDFVGLDDAGNRYYGLAGNDTVEGAGGDDHLLGGSGDDLLVGGIGNDRLEGGPGSDTFAFGLAAPGNDVITDFDRTNDKLSFTDVVDGDFDGVDLDDLLAMVASTVDDGIDVLVTYTTGATTSFQGVGTGAIANLVDLVDDPGSQISVA